MKMDGTEMYTFSFMFYENRKISTFVLFILIRGVLEWIRYSDAQLAAYQSYAANFI